MAGVEWRPNQNGAPCETEQLTSILKMMGILSKDISNPVCVSQQPFWQSALEELNWRGEEDN